MAYTLQPPFCKAGYRDVASGIDRYHDRPDIYFRLQIPGNRKLTPSHTDLTKLSQPCHKVATMPFYNLVTTLYLKTVARL